VTIPLGSPNYPTKQLSGRVTQPAWVAGAGARLTIAELIRYGACYEDEETPVIRPFTHFYNPQNAGAPLSMGVTVGSSSPQWVLKPGLDSNVLPTSVGPLKKGKNHFTYTDARNSFFTALIANNPSDAAASRQQRDEAWGKTFQALGHIMHHLQDMGSPQHVRDDSHCTAFACALALVRRRSGYELYYETKNQGDFIFELAQNAKSSRMFSMPHQFWNVKLDNALNTTNPTAEMNQAQGLAAHTSTHYPSAGKDFEAVSPPGATTSVAPRLNVSCLHSLTAPAFPSPGPTGSLMIHLRIVKEPSYELSG
jgi:hypothetical protein